MQPTRAVSLFLVVALAVPFAVQAGAADEAGGTSSAMQYVNDSAITTKIKAQLAEEKMNSLVNISVETDNAGAVSLTGRASTQDDADRAVQIARATTGVTAVNSHITIGTGN